MSTYSSVIPAMGSSGLFYNGPKAAFNRIADYVQFEHADDGILAFLIEPGFTMTDTLEATMGEAALTAFGPSARPRHPDETARTVVWLASDPDAGRFATPAMINAPDFFAANSLTPVGA
jgi:NAD(P)-dependent dehydrogenase (short-subunit alcohol dehydrogenase family)